MNYNFELGVLVEDTWFNVDGYYQAESQPTEYAPGDNRCIEISHISYEGEDVMNNLHIFDVTEQDIEKALIKQHFEL